jgi:hypothetical protein
MPTNPTLKRLGDFIQERSGLRRILDLVLRPVEVVVKKPIFGCHMCGQCVLHSTGMVCPMNCPKNIRNGPCGGVRADGHCEVYPERACVWVKAYQQSQRLFWPHEIHDLRPPVDWSMQGSSSWINYLTGSDQIKSGCSLRHISALQVTNEHVE